MFVSLWTLQNQNTCMLRCCFVCSFMVFRPAVQDGAHGRIFRANKDVNLKPGEQ